MTKRLEALMALQRPHFAQQVDVGKLHARLVGEWLRSLPTRTRLIAAGDAGSTARTVKERHAWMSVTNPTEVASTRERLPANHTDTKERTFPLAWGTNVAESPSWAIKAVSTASTERAYTLA
jgi:hypothetical protein